MQPPEPPGRTAARPAADRVAAGPSSGDRPGPGRDDQARATMTALASSTDVFEDFFDAAQIGLALADLSTRYVRVNPTYAQMLGRLPEDLIGVPFAEVLHVEDEAPTRFTPEDVLSGRDRHTTQRVQGYDGVDHWVLHGISVVPGTDGRPAWFAVSAQDITKQHQVESDLRTLSATMAERAVRDPLTGLANRSLLEERLRAVLSRDARSGASSGVLFLDLDGFKAVNDVHGHAAGDAVLRVVAERLRSAVRPSDTVARLGGDEFVVLAEGADGAALDALAARLGHSLVEPLTVDGFVLQVGVSVGTALAHKGDSDPQSLLNAADRRMYDAKRGHRP